jgi:hypothetical protein
METKIEIITITHQGKTSVWEVVEDASRYEGRRAHLQGTSAYYDMDKFESGLSKADSFTREQIN